jgi:hypothetical protein
MGHQTIHHLLHNVYLYLSKALRYSVQWQHLLEGTDILLPRITNLFIFKSNFILGLLGNMQQDDVPWVSLWF